MMADTDLPKDRLVYVMPRDQLVDDASAPISLIYLWTLLWRAKWIIGGVTLLFAALSVPYALSLAEWYRSDVLLVPTERRSTSGTLVDQLGGLAGLAGVSVGSSSSAEPLAIMRSRDFLRPFIVEQGLLPILFSDQWNEASGDWLVDDPGNIPDIRDAVRYFQDNVFSVAEESGTGLVTLTVTWTDPDVAAEWANLLVTRLNETLRTRALQEAETNVNYLQAQLAATSLVTLQQSIGRLLETELQKVMLARGNEEFAFRVVDRAEPPIQRARPNRRLIVVVATLLGGLLSVVGVFIFHAIIAIKETAARDLRAVRPTH